MRDFFKPYIKPKKTSFHWRLIENAIVTMNVSHTSVDVNKKDKELFFSLYFEFIHAR